MDKRTRVLSALNKKPVDHPPVGFWYHFAGEQAQGEGCVQAHLDYYRDTDLDFVKIMCDGYFNYPIPAEIKNAEDWWNLKPLGKDHPFIQEQVWRAKRIVEEVGKEFDVTRERIRQIEAKALRKLRHPSRSRKLRDYLD